MPTKQETIYTDIMHITQAFAKVGSMRFFKRAVIEHLFFEQLEEFITSELILFQPEKKILPLPQRTELEVDFKFQPNGHPIYLFAVKDSDKARLATISMLEFLRSNLTFTSVVVNEDFEKLSKRDRSLLTNTCDKQFTSLEQFKANGRAYLERQAVT